MLGKALLWPEPSLVFARGQQERVDDPKYGLITFGPYDRNVGSNAPDVVRISVIALHNQYFKFKSLLDAFETNVPTKWKATKFPFPGFSTLYKTKLSYPTRQEDTVTISDNDLKPVVDATDFDKFSTELIHLMCQKLQEAIDKDGRNAVYYVQIPPSAAAKAQSFESVSGLSVREIIKVAGIKSNAKTQLIDSTKSLEPADMADNLWNLALATYVKAGGVPWKLKEIPPASLFVGLSYGIRKEESGQTIFTGLAQLFNRFGEQVDMEALDFASGDYVFDPITEGYHLNREPMRKLVTAALDHYNAKQNDVPATLVLHKTTDFNETEKNGVLDSVTNASQTDMVHVVDSTPARLFGASTPTMRGTFWQIDQSRGLLYTTGWTDVVGTYPGIGTPWPIEVVRNHGTCGIVTLAKQLFALTKMNWDSTRVMIREPVTIDYARRVCNIIKAGLKPEALIRDIRYYL
jgi:hypothetical protein